MSGHLLTPRRKKYISGELEKQRWRREQKAKEKLREIELEEKKQELKQMDYKSYIKMKDLLCDNPTFKDYEKCNINILKKMANVLGILTDDITKDKLCKKINKTLTRGKLMKDLEKTADECNSKYNQLKNLVKQIPSSDKYLIDLEGMGEWLDEKYEELEYKHNMPIDRLIDIRYSIDNTCKSYINSIEQLIKEEELKKGFKGKLRRNRSSSLRVLRRDSSFKDLIENKPKRSSESKLF